MTLCRSRWLLSASFVLIVSGCDGGGNASPVDGSGGAAGRGGIAGGGGDDPAPADASGGSAGGDSSPNAGGARPDATTDDSASAGGAGEGGAESSVAGASAGGGLAAGGFAAGGDASGAAGAAPDAIGGMSSSDAGANAGGDGSDPLPSGGTSAGGTAGVGPSAGGAAGAGMGGQPAAGGNGGSGPATPGVCTFAVEGSLSEQIPTVGVIEWSTDLPGVTGARLQFTLDDPQEGELNVGSGGPISVSDSRALMLGLKPERSYTYRIVATAGETACVSEDHSLTTEAIPSSPTVTRTLGDAVASRANGFIVVCSYRGSGALIIDADGEVVWRAAYASTCSRSHMDWDGEYMWMMTLNASTGSTAGGSDGEVRRVRMDGSGDEEITGFEGAHHDFAVLPDGAAAFLVVADGGDTELVERSREGALTTVVRLNETGYLGDRGSFHPNALRYYARDDSYTVSDLQLVGVAQFDRQGEVLQQMGSCGNASGALCAALDMTGTHGHQLLENGNLLFFRAGYGGVGLGSPSPVEEYSFAPEGGELSATLEWSYVGENASLVLGDAQRFPNGNTLVVYSTDGVMSEVTPAGELVQSLSSSANFGYASFRETLYGPPQ